MDWSKAKTILIVAFIITNIILGFVLFKNTVESDRTLTAEFIEQSKEILQENNIKLNTEIPKYNPSLKTLIVEYEIIDLDRINRDYFGNEGKLSIGDSNNILLSYGSETVSIINQKILKYENTKEDVLYEKLDEDRVEAIAYKFLNNRRVDTEDMELSSIIQVDGVYKIRFSKIYKDRIIEKAYLNMEIDNTGVKTLDKLWVEVINEGDAEVYINTAPKALLNLISIDEARNKTIEKIDLIYYFDPEEHKYIEDPKKARKGRTIPAWRVLFSDGEKIILDNY